MHCTVLWQYTKWCLSTNNIPLEIFVCVALWRNYFPIRMTRKSFHLHNSKKRSCNIQWNRHSVMLLCKSSILIQLIMRKYVAMHRIASNRIKYRRFKAFKVFVSYWIFLDLFPYWFEPFKSKTWHKIDWFKRNHRNRYRENSFQKSYLVVGQSNIFDRNKEKHHKWKLKLKMFCLSNRNSLGYRTEFQYFVLFIYSSIVFHVFTKRLI